MSRDKLRLPDYLRHILDAVDTWWISISCGTSCRTICRRSQATSSLC